MLCSRFTAPGVDATGDSLMLAAAVSGQQGECGVLSLAVNGRAATINARATPGIRIRPHPLHTRMALNT